MFHRVFHRIGHFRKPNAPNLKKHQAFARTHYIADSQRDSGKNDSSSNKFRKIEDPIIFMSMLNDIDWTKKANYGECFSNFEKGEGFRKKISVGT